MPLIALVGAAVSAASAIKGGRDAKKAAKDAARTSIAEAMQRKQVAEYNATVLREQATRYRNEMVNRLKESSSINVGRLTEDFDINTFRLNEAYNLNVSRLGQSADRDTFRTVGDTATGVARTQEDALLNSARVQEVADTTVRRLERDATQEIVYGAEDENQIRRLAAENISATRAFYGARNIVIDSGTPAALQVDAARMGEVDALRVRRNYRIKAEALLERAADVKRDALWQIGDINRVAAYSVTDIRKEAGRNLEDIMLTTGQQIQDMTRDWGYNTADTKRVTEQQISDITRNLGYDLSDTEFEALKLDQQAALVILQGDADVAAGLNRADAYKTAGSNAMTSSILSAAGSVISQVDPKWLQRSTPAPVSTSQPSYVRP
jgi:hypothetical protein